MFKEHIHAKFKGQTIEINLPAECGHAGYSVECTYRYIKAREKYSLSMWLKYNSIDCKFNMNPQEVDSRYIAGTKNTIVDNICEVVKQLCESRFFDHYVERYEYEMKCFERGHDLFEKEQLGKADVCNV